MINKEVYLEHLQTIQAVVEKYGENETVSLKIENCRKEIQDFSMKILFVGGFSTGKSALLNTFIGKDLLTEDQKPETAIASEIVYGLNEHIELIGLDQKVTTIGLDEVHKIHPEELQFIRYHVDSPKLRKYKAYTFVDMPGFNSGIDRHNKAILQYAQGGNAYILVIDCEDGEIKASVQDFMDEIRQYDHNISIAVSKADKKPASHMEEIIRNIKETATDIFGDEVMVLATSKYQEGTQEKVQQLLGGFKEQEVFEDHIKPYFYELEKYSQALLNRLASTEDEDTSQMDDEIRKRTKALENLEQFKVKEGKKLHQIYKDKVKPSLLADVEEALMNKADYLVDQLRGGDEVFNRTVNDIVRPVLVTSLEQYREESFSEFVQGLEIGSIFDEDSRDDLAHDIELKYRTAQGFIHEILEVADKNKAAYKTMFSIFAVTTTVVAPWLELIILFLPDLLKVAGKFTKSSENSKLSAMIKNKIIPEIMGKLSRTIDPDLLMMEKQDLQGVENKIQHLIKTEIDALKSAKTMKETQKTTYDQLMEGIRRDANDLKEMVENL